MLVSVVILNYNGKQFLRRVVESALALNWRELEVIVVDNASSDGSADEIERDFGARVRVIRRTVNSATAGRNQGFREARGEFVLSIDNDIVLPDCKIVEKAVALFERFADVGVLACKIGSEENPNAALPEHWWFPVAIEDASRSFYSDYVCEGAAFLRKSAVAASGGYDEDFFWGFEAVDFALRMLSSGFEILYCPSLVSVELRVRRESHNRREINNLYSLRNRLWTAWKHFPFWKAVWFGATRVAVAGVRAVRGGWVDYFWRGAREGIFAPAVIRAKRRPLGAAVWRRIGEIRRGDFVDPMGTPLPLPLDVNM